jgi:copper chaperone
VEILRETYPPGVYSDGQAVDASLGALAAVPSTCPEKVTAMTDSTPRPSATETLRVDGMTCEHCVASVTEELTEVAGVTDVSIELVVGGSSIVTVTTDAPVATPALHAAVEEAGYQVASR